VSHIKNFLPSIFLLLFSGNVLLARQAGLGPVSSEPQEDFNMDHHNDVARSIRSHITYLSGMMYPGYIYLHMHMHPLMHACSPLLSQRRL